MLVLVLLHLLEIHQRLGALVDDLGLVFLLERRGDGAVHPRSEVGGAADHDLLRLGAHDRRKAGDDGGSAHARSDQQATPRESREIIWHGVDLP